MGFCVYAMLFFFLRFSLSWRTSKPKNILIMEVKIHRWKSNTLHIRYTTNKRSPSGIFSSFFVLKHRMLLISVIFRVVGGENVCIILNIVYLHMLQLHPSHCYIIEEIIVSLLNIFHSFSYKKIWYSFFSRLLDKKQEDSKIFRFLISCLNWHQWNFSAFKEGVPYTKKRGRFPVFFCCCWLFYYPNLKTITVVRYGGWWHKNGAFILYYNIVVIMHAEKILFMSVISFRISWTIHIMTIYGYR